ncbi:hypothetical protein RND71_002101 [Anisodus tanguticus]|uniref:Uncharacterized protein n=1 Tax=Anisodus tanguticus TaxID=243964 RepID=A0AAE1T260_9SOLA|nr:hypothetical protein RND71_002101 [Anisodus tanguticus]
MSCRAPIELKKYSLQSWSNIPSWKCALKRTSGRKSGNDSVLKIRLRPFSIFAHNLSSRAPIEVMFAVLFSSQQGGMHCISPYAAAYTTADGGSEVSLTEGNVNLSHKGIHAWPLNLQNHQRSYLINTPIPGSQYVALGASRLFESHIDFTIPRYVRYTYHTWSKGVYEFQRKTRYTKYTNEIKDMLNDGQQHVNETHPLKLGMHCISPSMAIYTTANGGNKNPHPNEKRRLEFGKELSMDSKQLRIEQSALKEFKRNAICNQCANRAIIGEISVDDKQTKIEVLHPEFNAPP